MYSESQVRSQKEKAEGKNGENGKKEKKEVWQRVTTVNRAKAERSTLEDEDSL